MEKSLRGGKAMEISLTAWMLEKKTIALMTSHGVNEREKKSWVI